MAFCFVAAAGFLTGVFALLGDFVFLEGEAVGPLNKSSTSDESLSLPCFRELPFFLFATLLSDLDLGRGFCSLEADGASRDLDALFGLIVFLCALFVTLLSDSDSVTVRSSGCLALPFPFCLPLLFGAVFFFSVPDVPAADVDTNMLSLSSSSEEASTYLVFAAAALRVGTIFQVGLNMAEGGNVLEEGASVDREPTSSDELEVASRVRDDGGSSRLEAGDLEYWVSVVELPGIATVCFGDEPRDFALETVKSSSSGLGW